VEGLEEVRANIQNCLKLRGGLYEKKKEEIQLQKVKERSMKMKTKKMDGLERDMWVVVSNQRNKNNQ